MKLLQVCFEFINTKISSDLDIDLPSPLDPEGLIDALSEVIASPGLLRPLVVMQTDINEYNLVDSTFEYFALAKYFKANPDVDNYVNVVVVYPDEYDEAIKQLEVFRKLDSRP